MSKRPQFQVIILCAMLFCAGIAATEDSQKQKLDRQFQDAVANYDAGKYAEAAAQLEEILPHGANTFEVQELLGLVYASQSQEAKAVEHLKIAVRLNRSLPRPAQILPLHCCVRGKQDSPGSSLRKAVELDPKSFDTNRNLGQFYIQSGKIAEALPLLERAQQIDPTSYDNGYDLALAYFLTGKLSEARVLVHNMVKIKNTGELHDLLGQIEEKDGNYVAAANEFETASHIDPSESNLFDWGSELLLHRTYEPAIDVFQQATRLYPKSPRLMIGLGMALYSRGKYDEAVKALPHCRGSQSDRSSLLLLPIQGLLQFAEHGGRRD